MRDRIAIALANWVLRHIATKRTCQMLDGTIEYGMRAAARDSRLGQEPPPDWRTPTHLTMRPGGFISADTDYVTWNGS